MSEKIVIRTIQVPANATKEQLLAVLAEANTTIGYAAAANAKLERACVDYASQINALVDARDQLQEQVSNLTEAGEKTASEHAGRGTHVRVSSAHKAGQHYRAGRLWTRDAIDVHKDDLTAEQLDAMHADPMLVVVNV